MNIDLDRARVYFNKDDVPLIVKQYGSIGVPNTLSLRFRGLPQNRHKYTRFVQQQQCGRRPQAYFKKNQGKLIVDGKHSVLKNINRVDLQILHDKSSNLPMIFGASANITNLFANATTDHDYLRAMLSVTDIQNQNVSSSQKELLRDHFVYRHANMQWIQTLKRTRVYEMPEGTDEHGLVLPCKLKRARSCATPKCGACQLAKKAQMVEEPTCNTVAP
eukprot:scaffold224920_cov33-Attheya_sp.AAC.2